MAPKVLSHTILTQEYSDTPLSRKIVPADNSCLFASMSYVMTGDVSMATDLRHLIAKCVSSDPEMYNSAFLGKDNSEYCSWIQNCDNWGGAIELSILCKYYEVEIAVVDTETERIDRFGKEGTFAISDSFL
ncbi:Ubiquitin thioesterase OTU1 [Exaiptasia diaphana]|nr:Ubiquitin thioesterase OTU1 [Exaiptasia diaphana]